MSAVASVLAHTGVSLGILPLGTLNHFAKDLQIPTGLEEAIELIAKGRSRKVDMGEVNGRRFINNSSIGIYPRLVKNREDQRLKLGIGKWPALALAVFMVLQAISRCCVSNCCLTVWTLPGAPLSSSWGIMFTI